jgi:hypothetical protein
MTIFPPPQEKVLPVIRLSPMGESRLYKIAHCNQSVSSGAPARRREPPIRGEKSIMTGPCDSLIKIAHHR